MRTADATRRYHVASAWTLSGIISAEYSLPNFGIAENSTFWGKRPAGCIVTPEGKKQPTAAREAHGQVSSLCEGEKACWRSVHGTLDPTHESDCHI